SSLATRRSPISTLFPYTTLFRSTGTAKTVWASISGVPDVSRSETATRNPLITNQHTLINELQDYHKLYTIGGNSGWANMNALVRDRKSTRLNSSHVKISYAVFCL